VGSNPRAAAFDDAVARARHFNNGSQLAQQATRDFWASECYNMTQTGFVDGCFSDRAVGGIRSCNLSAAHSAAYDAGHIAVHQQLQELIGNGPLIANGAIDMPGVNAVQIEDFKADNVSIVKLLECVANGKIVEAHAGYGVDGDADDHCSKGIVNSLAAFLIGLAVDKVHGRNTLKLKL
jgi:hypothetical protein